MVQASSLPSTAFRQIAGEKLVEYPLHGVPSPLTAAHLLRDRNGGLWIGTNAHGVVHSYEGKTSLFSHRDGLSSDRVIALFEDREGTIWVATPDGLDQFRESPIGSLSDRDGLSSATATSILAARDGSIWIGTADGLNRWNARTRRRSIGSEAILACPTTRSNPCSRMSAVAFGSQGFAALQCSKRAGLLRYRQCLRGLRMRSQATTTAACGSVCGSPRMIMAWCIWLEGKIIEQAPWKNLGGGPGSGLVRRPGRRRLDRAAERRDCVFPCRPNPELAIGR